MVTKLIAIAAATLLALVVGLAYLGHASHKPPALGLVNGKLRPCPATPNCVCSEPRTDQAHAIDPIRVWAPHQAWQALQQAIIDQGGIITQADAHYLHATFTSTLFRFVDDVEARLDEEAKAIQLRSASRVGRSDFGVNRQRIAAITAAYSAILGRQP